MEQRKEEVTRRPLYGKYNCRCSGPYRLTLTPLVYDLPQDILSTLARKDDTKDGPQQDITASPAVSDQTLEPRAESGTGAQSCSLCGVAFHTVEDQRSHIRSDLHGYNLKQRIRGAKPVTEGDFEKLIGGAGSIFCLTILPLTSARS